MTILREDIGLGSPPKAFYTNNSESINALLKECTGYKKQQWALFNDKMKEAVLLQQREIEKAIIGYGEYRLRPQYSSLTVSVEKWFCMSTEQRQHCINKLNTATVHQYSNSQCLTSDTCEQPLTAAISEQPLTPVISKHSLPSTVSEQPLTLAFSEEPLTSAISGQQLQSTSASTINPTPTSAALDTRSQDITIGCYATTETGQTAAGEEHSLSVPLKDAIASTLLPYTTVEGIWKKAASLISEVNAIVPALGLGPREKMVKSKSGSTPHLISVNGFKYECDDKCPHFKSIKLCSHTVAASEVNGELKEFIKWIKSKGSCDTPNLMQLGTHGMPAGAGRKAGKVAKKKQTSKRATPSDDNRVALDTTPRIQCQMQSNFNATVSPVTASFTYDHATYLPSYSSSHLDSYVPSTSGGPSVLQQPQYPTYPPWMWSPPPWVNPVNSIPPSPPDSPYKLCLKRGNISICNGCRNNFTKAYSIVIQHAEFCHFTSPQSGLPASKFGNAYYHPRRVCIELKTGLQFDARNLVIVDSIKEHLTASQKQHLYQEFGLSI